jgi:hypothetical protein
MVVRMNRRSWRLRIEFRGGPGAVDSRLREVMLLWFSPDRLVSLFGWDDLFPAGITVTACQLRFFSPLSALVRIAVFAYSSGGALRLLAEHFRRDGSSLVNDGLKGRRRRRCASRIMCAGHVRRLGGASPLRNLMEVKRERSARAGPRGTV